MFDTRHNTPGDELAVRIFALQSVLERQSLDAALILQNADLYYFAGTVQQSHLFIPRQGDPLMMVRKDFARARAESALSRVIPMDSPQDIVTLLRQHGLAPPRRLGMELDVLPVNRFRKYQQLFDPAEIEDIATAIRLIRAVKSPYELGLMRQAAAFADQVAGSVAEFLREGISEIELAGMVEGRARALGHQGIIRMRLWGSELFYGHLMAGPSAADPGYLSSPTGGAAVSPAVAQGSGLRSIGRHEPVLVDYVFAHQGYLADHSRIFSIGPLPDNLMKAHAAMLDLQETLKKAARPGVASGELFRVAHSRAEKMGYGDHFMGYGKQRIRFVGHGLGLELDEFPFLAHGQKLALQAGMTLALEPKLVFADVGVVGIENTHVVTSEGLEALTQYADEVVVV